MAGAPDIPVPLKNTDGAPRVRWQFAVGKHLNYDRLKTPRVFSLLRSFKRMSYKFRS